MATSVKDLPAVDNTNEMKCGSEIHLDGHASYMGTSQYISGAGTIQVEVTTQVTDPAVWTPPLDFSNPPVALAAQAAVGIVAFRLGGVARVRQRKTVGVASLIAGLGVD